MDRKQSSPSRVAIWDRQSNYEKEVFSLWHVPCGDTLRDLIFANASRGPAADLGCGPGYWLAHLGALADPVYAIDFSPGMIAQARTRAPDHTVFLQQELSALALPQPVQTALCLNAVMPESHSHALAILRAVFGCLAPGGRLILVLPSFEAKLFSANINHFLAAERGQEEASLVANLDAWTECFSNPLGYFRNPNGTVVKYWLQAEAETVFERIGGVRKVECARLPFVRNEQAAFDATQEWLWCWVLERIP